MKLTSVTKLQNQQLFYISDDQLIFLSTLLFSNFASLFPSFHQNIYRLATRSMADPFSIAAGVVGVISLSMQLVQTSRKLSGILKSIKDLPDEVDTKGMELEMLSDILQQDRDASVAGKKATQHLQKLSKLLKSLLDDIQNYISRTKHKVSWKAIKATMRKDAIDQLFRRMTRCLRLLQMVNQVDFQ